MSAAQWLFEQLLNNALKKNNTRLLKWKTGFLRMLRRQLIRHADPLVQWSLGGKRIWINLSHELPFLLAAYPNYNANLPRIACKVNEKYPLMTCIDVGANIGDTVALLRQTINFPILCFDGEQRFVKILKKNITLFKDVFFENTFLGNKTEIKTLGIHVKNGTANLEPFDHSQNQIQLQTLDHALERWPNFKNSKLIKIDTDGFDAKIIRGAKQFLSHSQPIIFFEYDPYFLEQQGDDGLSLLEELRQMGYCSAIIYENVGDYMISVNLDDKQILKEIHLYFSARKGAKYCDICLFHKNDQDIFENCRCTEPFFYPRQRL